jgi:hypothetical protein
MKMRKNEFLYFRDTHIKKSVRTPLPTDIITLTTHVLELSFTLQDNFDCKVVANPFHLNQILTQAPFRI